jgi:glycerol-3-phosphate dehydrogenase (NAD(P)+)
MLLVTAGAVHSGASPLTLAGLAGVGDIVLTCTGDLSRNRSVGVRLGKGEKLADITAAMKGAVAEGVLTSRSAHHLALKQGIECPVIEGIYKVSGNPPACICLFSEVVGAGGDQVAAERRMPPGSMPFPPHHLACCLQVIHEGADPVEVVTKNMSRPLKAEVDQRVAQAAHH